MGAGKSKPMLQDEFRANRSHVRRAIRELERERATLEAEERRLGGEIRTAVQSGQLESARTFARDIIRVRRQQKKCLQARSHFMSTGMRLQSMQTAHAISGSVGSVAGSMARLNKLMCAGDGGVSVLDCFAEECARLGDTEENFADSLDAALTEPGDNQAEDAVITKVLDEVGVDITEKLAAAPSVSSTLPSLSAPLPAGPAAVADPKIRLLDDRLRLL